MGITPIFLIFGVADTEIIHSSSFIIHSSLFRFVRRSGAINRKLAVLGLWIAVDFVFFLRFRQWPICGIVGQEEAVSTSPGGSAVDVRAVELCVVPEDAGRYGGTEHRLCGRVLLPEQE
jgi:hypothetical protein